MRPDELTQLLREERELPTPEFSAELDAWAAAGFPRAESSHGIRSGWDALRQRLASTPPRRIIAPAGAALTLIVVTAVAIGEAGNIGGSDEGGPVAIQTRTPSGALTEGPAASANAAKVPEAASAGNRLEAAPRGVLGDKSAQNVPFDQRKIARTVDLSLATSAGDFHDAADGVLDVVEAHRGFVPDSNVTGRRPGREGLAARAGKLRPPHPGEPAGLGTRRAVRPRARGVALRRRARITSSFVAVKKRIGAFEKTRANLLTSSRTR